MDDNDKQCYVHLTNRKRKAQEIVDKCNALLGPLESALLDHMGSVGMDSFRLNGHTVYIQSTLWARPKGGDHLATADAFRRLADSDPVYEGLRDMAQLKFNTSSLSKVFRDWEKGGFEPPEAITEAVDLSREYRLIVRRGGGK